ncbi:aldehyde dehydrogenase [Endozoicomonas sp. SM1973]|uniref:Aldehyde dehydrogenase n=1 Tax=Spartinivicinus marinus TaxID=2994442 RepID=A0A853IC08_9GAMM|nr:aldehyde dehydrogenase [Spartinivicinus marinus]MCX4027051.1 aldehyde dehydrogenase [Spartinivicinus marinus]NYZ67047.1 aldehyde dehydrogenase [Spartinivicinus marinus]
MSDLLTHDEYLAIAADLNPPSMSFIDGRFRPAKSGNTLATINPATGKKLADIAACDKEDVDFAVEKARESFDDGRWRCLHPSERKDVLIRLCKLIARNRRELAVLEALDSGKPIKDCETIDIPELIHTIKWHAEAIDKIYDQTAPVGNDAISIIVREPIGVVGAVLPWNFPLLMLAWKMGPALAAGCSMVIKPAEQTSLTALRIAELAMEAGLPRGVLNIVTGTGKDVGEPIGMHRDVDMVSFTGSTATGRCFLRYAADSNLKKVVLECGGKNPCIVLEDAEDLDRVAAQVVNAAFWNMGENCSAGSRLIVHKKIKEELLERVKAHAREWRTGDPLDPANHLGALVDQNHFKKVASYLHYGKDSGKQVILGGETTDGIYVQPTIFDGVDSQDRLAQEEIFGPVLSVITVGSYDEAIQVANNTDYGLAASVFTANAKRALRAAQAVRAGTVTVNCFGEGDITTPFGGYKQSGFGGRDNSIHAHDQYTELKTIWLDISDPVDEACVD